MADRAEKCAEEIVADVFPSMDTNCAVRYVEQATKIIRSHYPDDRELLEAAKEELQALDNMESLIEFYAKREMNAPANNQEAVRDTAERLAAFRKSHERLRTAIERRG